MKLFKTMLFFTAFLSCSHPALTQEMPSEAQIVDRAIAKIGGESAIEFAKKIRIVYRGFGNFAAVHQGRYVDKEEQSWRQETMVLDLENELSAYREEYAQTDGTPAMWLWVVKKEKGVQINLKTQRSIGLSKESVRSEYENNRWKVPHLVLLKLKENISNVTFIGNRTIENTPCNVLQFNVSSNIIIEVLFEKKSGLLKGYSFFTEMQTGSKRVDYLFKSYKHFEKLGLFPSGYKAIIDKRVYRDMDLFDVRNSSNIPDSPWFTWLEEDLPPVLNIVRQETKAEQVAPNAWLFRNIIGYNALVVDIGSGLVIVDAPASFPVRVPLKTERQANSGASLLLSEINKTFPDRKILYVVPTHHHNDHFGAIKALSEAGIKIITTPGNMELTKQVCANPEIITLKDSLTLGSGANQLVIYSFQTLHADEMLFAYLPESKIVFEADISDYVLASKQFLQFVEKKKLNIEKIYGSHNSRVANLVGIEEDDPSN